MGVGWGRLPGGARGVRPDTDGRGSGKHEGGSPQQVPGPLPWAVACLWLPAIAYLLGRRSPPLPGEGQVRKATLLSLLVYCLIPRLSAPVCLLRVLSKYRGESIGQSMGATDPDGLRTELAKNA